MSLPQTSRNVLIIQPGALGDSILTLPLVRWLREVAGAERVSMMGHLDYLSVLRGRSAVHRVISLEGSGLNRLFANHASFELPEVDPLIEFFRDYHLILTFLADERGDFEKNLIYTTNINHFTEVITVKLRPGADYPSHCAQFFIEQAAEELLGNADESQGTENKELASFLTAPHLSLREEDREKGRALLAGRGVDLDTSLIVMHPGSGGVEKCWPLENYREMARLLGQKGFQVIMLLGPAELERWGVETLTLIRQEFMTFENYPLPEVAAILSHGRCFIGNDSGLSHLAGALDLPVISIFGPTNSLQWRSLGNSVKILEKKISWPSVEDVFAIF